MSNKISQVINYQGQFDASKVYATIDQIKKKLLSSGVKIDFVSKLDKDFDKIIEKSNKLEAKLKTGFKNSADVANIGKELNSITQMYFQLNTQIQRMDVSLADLDLPDAFVQEINSVNSKISSLNEELKQVKNNANRIEGFKQIMPQDAINDVKGFSKLLVDNIQNEQTFQSLIEGRKNSLEKSIALEEQSLQPIIEKKKKYEEIAELTKRIASGGKVKNTNKDAISNLGVPGYQKSLDKKGTLNLLSKNSQKLTKDEQSKLDALEDQKKAYSSMAQFETTALNLRGQMLNKEKAITLELQNQVNIKQGKVDAALQQTKSGIQETSIEMENYSVVQKQTLDQELDGYQKSVDALEKKNKLTSELTGKVGMIFGMAKAYELVARTIRTAFSDVADLDAELTAIAVVTDKTTKQLWGSFSVYNEMAQKLGVTTKDAMSTSKLYYQQGLATADVMTLTAETIKMARIAGMDYATATNQMTAAIRGFKLETSDAGRVNDVFSALAAKAAVDTQELAYALTKTASIAKSAGMELETTSAFLTQMIETTREAPENIGTAMKTIIARFQELKQNPASLSVEVDGETVEVNKVEKALKSANVKLRDTTGQFRNLDDVFLELASKWDSLDRNTQRYIATISAGSRQQSRFIAMMDNYKRTVELVGIAENSSGQANLQFSKTMDSLDAKLNQLKTSFQEFYTKLFNSELFKAVVDGINGILKMLNGLPAPVAIIFATIGAVITKNILLGIIRGFSEGKDIFNTFKAELASKPADNYISFKVFDVLKAKLNELKAELFGLENRATADVAAAKGKQTTAATGTQVPTTPVTTDNKNGTTPKEGAKTSKLGGTGKVVGGAIASSLVAALIVGLTSEDAKSALKAGISTLLMSLLPVILKGMSSLAVKIGGALVADVGVGALAAVGAVVAAVAAVAFIAWRNSAEQKAKRAEKEARERYEKTTKELEDKQNEMTEASNNYGSMKSAIDEYEELYKTVGRTAEQQKRMNELSNSIGEQVPELVQGYDKFGNAILTSTNNLSNYLKEQKVIVDELQNQTINLKVKQAKDEVDLKKAEFNKKQAEFNKDKKQKDKIYAQEMDRFHIEAVYNQTKEGAALYDDYMSGKISQKEYSEEVNQVISDRQAYLQKEYDKYLESLDQYKLAIEKSEQRLNSILKQAASESLKVELNFAFDGEEIPKEITSEVQQLTSLAMAKEYEGAKDDKAREDITRKYAELLKSMAANNPKVLAEVSKTFGNLSNLSFEELDKLIVNGIQGLDPKLQAALQKRAEDIKKQATEVLKGIATLSGGVDYSQGMKLGLDFQNSFAQALQKINSPESRAEVTKQMNNLLGAINITDNIDAQKILASADLSTAKGMMATIQSLQNVGVNAKDATAEILAYAQALDNTQGYMMNPSQEVFAQNFQQTAQGIRQLTDNFKDVTAAMQEVTENGKLSYNTVLSLIESGNALALTIDEGTGAIRVNEEVSKEAFNQKLDEEIAIMQMEKAKADAMYQALEIQASIEGKKLEMFQQTGETTYDITSENLDELTKLEENNAVDVADGKLKINEEFMSKNQQQYNAINEDLANSLNEQLRLYKAAKDEQLKILTDGKYNNVDAKAAAIDTTEFKIGDYKKNTNINSGYDAKFESERIGRVTDLRNRIANNKAVFESSAASYKKLSENYSQGIKLLTGMKKAGIEAFADKGSSAASKKAEEYVTKLAKLFNLLQKIERLEAKREELNSQKDILTEVGDIAQNNAQLMQISKDLQSVYKEFAEANKQEMASLQSQLQQTYGAYVDFSKGYLEINYKKVAAMGEEGGAFEDLVNKYKEASKSLDEYNNKQIDEIKYRQERIKAERDAYISIQEKIVDILKKRDQEEIDNVKKKYDLIKKQDTDYVNSLRKNIDAQRALRDKDKQKEDLATKEKRLALLKRDTSGAYAKEILQLEQELSEQRQTMADTEIDNMISDLEEKNQANSDAYDKEVEYLQSANDRKLAKMTAYWDEVNRIMTGQYGDAFKWLKKYDEEFNTSSKEQQNKWLEDWKKTFGEAKSYAPNLAVPGAPSTPAHTPQPTPRPAPAHTPAPSAPPTPQKGSSVTVKTTATNFGSKSNNIRMKSFVPGGKYTVYGNSGGQVLIGRNGVYTGWVNQKDLVGYSKGGMVDQTGPVMVHGSKNKPEAFLNAKDTENVAALRDVLRRVFSNKDYSVDKQSNEKVGDIYYEIHFDIESLDSDYSVDEAMNRMEKKIISISQQNNVTAVRKIR